MTESECQNPTLLTVTPPQSTTPPTTTMGCSENTQSQDANCGLFSNTNTDTSTPPLAVAALLVDDTSSQTDQASHALPQKGSSPEMTVRMERGGRKEGGVIIEVSPQEREYLEMTGRMDRGSREERSPIVEVDVKEEAHSNQETSIDLETEGKWARQDKERQGRERENEKDEPIVVEDLETLEMDAVTANGQHEHYVFDVPAVRNHQEIEAADRALEKLANKPPGQLSKADRVWELAARGGSTLASENVSLDQESKQKLKKTIRKKKLTDKTTLAF